MGYSFPNKAKDLLCYSDTFYSWGEFWNKFIQNTFNKDIVNGFQYFRDNINTFSKVKKEEKILIISQSALGENIMSETLRMINLFDGFEIFYKLHPAEYIIYKDYSAYSELMSQPHVTFVTDCNLYELNY